MRQTTIFDVFILFFYQVMVRDGLRNCIEPSVSSQSDVAFLLFVSWPFAFYRVVNIS